MHWYGKTLSKHFFSLPSKRNTTMLWFYSSISVDDDNPESFYSQSVIHQVLQVLSCSSFCTTAPTCLYHLDITCLDAILTLLYISDYFYKTIKFHLPSLYFKICEYVFSYISEAVQTHFRYQHVLSKLALHWLCLPEWIDDARSMMVFI